MKRFFSTVLAMLLLAALAVPALADVAYMPRDNFLEKHMEECNYENRSWYTNGTEGYVKIYDSPASGWVAVVPNGLAYSVSYTYDNGSWGCIEYDPNDPAVSMWGGASGWVKMEEMTHAYDYRAFDEDHAAEYWETETVTVETSDGIYGYKYPGSGEVVEKLAGDWASNPLEFQTLFTDPAGRNWGFVGYYYGHRNFWVCVDDPRNPWLEADENFKTAITIPAAEPAVMEAAMKGAKMPTAYLYAGAAGVVVIAAAVLFAAIRKKKKA